MGLSEAARLQEVGTFRNQKTPDPDILSVKNSRDPIVPLGARKFLEIIRSQGYFQTRRVQGPS